MTILYVDDDPEDLEIFHDAVRTVDPSIKYISAKSAQEALKFLRAADTLPDYLVLDINMPGMDGKLCLRKIREDPKLRNINAVVYSTNSFPRDIEEIQSLDATFIKKANSFNDLSKIIRDLVGK